jgi:hypothetical protein
VTSVTVVSVMIMIVVIMVIVFVWEFCQETFYVTVSEKPFFDRDFFDRHKPAFVVAG